MQEKDPSKGKTLKLWITAGVVGALFSSLCCLTPLAVILLGVAGLGAWTGYPDYVVLPSLTFFLGVVGYGVYSQQCFATKRGKVNEKNHGVDLNHKLP